MESKIQQSKETNQKQEERIVRILSQDIEGKMRLYAGLARIKGLSWGMSNAICKILGLDKNRRIGSLTNEEIKKISDLIKNTSKVPSFLLNRRVDFSSGEDIHLIGSDLELQRDFDIKRLRQMRSYRGYRHALGLPLRGQRTKSNFRKNRGKGVGIKKKKKTTKNKK
jgi:small subunit ribosomal protein S13